MSSRVALNTPCLGIILKWWGMVGVDPENCKR